LTPQDLGTRADQDNNLTITHDGWVLQCSTAVVDPEASGTGHHVGCRLPDIPPKLCFTWFYMEHDLVPTFPPESLGSCASLNSKP
jgi:hypothetical protein